MITERKATPNLIEIANKYRDILDRLVEKYNFDRFIDNVGTSERISFSDWHDKANGCEDYFEGISETYGDLYFAFGCTRCCMFNDDYDAVIKFNTNSYYDIDYCADEAASYAKAVEAGVESAFTWCYHLFDYTTPSGTVIPIYAYQFCDAGGEYMSDNSYSALYNKYCSDHGFEGETGHEEEFSNWLDDECINYDDSDGMILYAATVWGNEFAEKVQEFCNANRINDIHAGNWGIVNGNCPIICDYAGYGEYECRGIISVF
jgi:hypothetical protein